MESSHITSNKRGLDDLSDNSINKKLRADISNNVDGRHKLMMTKEIRHEKFNTVIFFYELRMCDLDVKNVSDAMSAVEEIFKTIIDGVTVDVRPSDLLQLSFQTPSIESAIHLPSMKCSVLTVDNVIDQIEGKLNYNSHFVLEKTISITCVRVRIPDGGAKKKPEVNLDMFLHESKSVIQILNKDELCCARAIVTATARIEKHPRWNNIRRGLGVQKDLAIELHRLAGVDEQQCGVEEIKKFQAVMPKYKIYVLSKECFNNFVYVGPDDGIPIYLYLHDNHYDVITTITGFLKRSYFCKKCLKGYNDKEKHMCNSACRVCRRFHEDVKEEWYYCSDCHRYFISATCYKLHKEKNKGGKSTCDNWFKCRQCKVMIDKKRRKTEHMCGEKYCLTCKGHFANGHKCYMQPIKNVNFTDQSSQKYIFVEFRSIVDEVIQCSKTYTPDETKRCVNCNKSECGIPGSLPNLCIVHKTCDSCMDMEVTDTSTCSSCGPNKKIFRGKDCANLFCKWLFSPENKDTTVLCHNLTEEKSSHILRYLYDNGHQPKVITSGSRYKCIEVSVCKMRILDSQNFIPLPLADMARSFEEVPLQEGFFPVLFNTKDNQTTVLNGLPDIQFYNVEGMTLETRNVFQSWYQTHRDDHFNFQEQLLRYCESDVDILRRCCLKFRSMFMNISKGNKAYGTDPFQQCVTIASACNTVYKSNYMEPESIAIIPHEGYNPEATQSVVAFQWLSFIAHKKGVDIQHARNKGEKVIGPYKVDGFFKNSNGQKCVLEFNGCFWHGCPKCYSRDTYNARTKCTMDALYKKTVDKQAYLEKMGYKYESIWECDYRTELLKNSDMAAYIKSLDIESPIQPKDAFYGGRAEGFKLFETTTEHRRIKYYDVTSLYPHINKTGKVPLGHPTIIKEGFDNIDKYEGLIKCKILAPRQLYVPVLPVSINGEVVFSLCRACSSQHNVNPCMHNEAGRAFTGTWVTDEVKLALKHGYRILKVYEVWHFDRISQYDPETKTGGAFTGYVNTFLKLKQEASGWPKWCKTDEDKKKYVESYYAREGISLNYDNIRENPGLRASAKLMLNSFWGKFGQRPNYVRSVCITDPSKYFDILMSTQIDTIYICFVNDETIRVDYVYKDNFISTSSQSNVVIAAYTTAQARLRLYDCLAKLGRRTIYCDTDAIAFSHISGQWEPPLGDYLGDFTDVVEGNQILNFTTLSPKVYAYDLAHPDKHGCLSICKVRGFNLRLRSLLNINGQTMKDLALSCKKCSNALQMKSSLQVNYAKRIIIQGDITYPYGFQFS
ncbi:uncharacterized protein LOC123544812 [Mercenaria mercenaria]|uniref:uncharacterized protein LOC123544812 n=1 Tax=Mercenaria mercenaria TaxID=6596 RepID=UPI00234E47D5|nr:uncharacterized protein LOC123544812 [Mercenaria mercenaria]